MENRSPNLEPLVSPPAKKVPEINSSSVSGSQCVPFRLRLRGLILTVVILLFCFGRVLFDLGTYALHSEFYSYILLIPFISGYLVWLKRGHLIVQSRINWGFALLPATVGAMLLFGFGHALGKNGAQTAANYFAAMTLSFLFFLLSAGVAFLGIKAMRAITFPVAFLFFSDPFPESVRHAFETFLQQGSAEVAYLMLRLSGMPVFRTGTKFQLPGFLLEVAPQCSGIHSSLVLIITSLLGGYLILKSPWNRLVFVLAVIPLALLRNGVRIFTIAQLCVHISPAMIDSPIHHRGGPIFFVLSLVPLFLLLAWLRKREVRTQSNSTHHE